MKVSEGAYHPSQMHRGLVLDRDTGHLVVLIGPCHNIGCETLNEIFFFIVQFITPCYDKTSVPVWTTIGMEFRFIEKPTNSGVVTCENWI
jgi:hypothetical protein